MNHLLDSIFFRSFINPLLFLDVNFKIFISLCRFSLVCSFCLLFFIFLRLFFLFLFNDSIYFFIYAHSFLTINISNISSFPFSLLLFFLPMFSFLVFSFQAASDILFSLTFVCLLMKITYTLTLTSSFLATFFSPFLYS